MTRLFLLLTVSASFSTGLFAQKPAIDLWNELKAKREALPGLHQEFEFVAYSASLRSSRGAERQVIIDTAQNKWREKQISGSGITVRIFDGQNVFAMEEGGDEFVRVKRVKKEADPQPRPIGSIQVDWSKVMVREHRPCGYSANDHDCVFFEAPLIRWNHPSPNSYTRLQQGSAGLLVDSETGIETSVRIVQTFETPHSTWQTDEQYVMKRVIYGAPADAALFAPPAGLKEVKELSRWDAPKIKAQLAGKAAPQLSLVDIHGKPISLADLEGKTVLLDFWTTWCPPCRADAPALDRLYKKYGGKDLAIIGISVSEEHSAVEKYLKEHPHEFPIALTTDNEMPRPYQISAFPTYIVIDRKGAVASAAEGDKGFSELRSMLKKGGLEIE